MTTTTTVRPSYSERPEPLSDGELDELFAGAPEAPHEDSLEDLAGYGDELPW